MNAVVDLDVVVVWGVATMSKSDSARWLSSTIVRDPEHGLDFARARERLERDVGGRPFITFYVGVFPYGIDFEWVLRDRLRASHNARLVARFSPRNLRAGQTPGPNRRDMTMRMAEKLLLQARRLNNQIAARDEAELARWHRDVDHYFRNAGNGDPEPLEQYDTPDREANRKIRT